MSAELVQSYLDITGELGETLFLIVFLAPLYGGAALLIREIAVRRGLGWPGILLLAAAFGVTMPGLVDLSLFTEHSPDVTGWDDLWAPTQAWGMSWHPAFTWSAAHVVMSIGVPLALLDALAPATRGRSLLGWKGLTVLTGLCVGVAALIRRDAAAASIPTWLQTTGVLVVVAALVGLALSRIGRPLRRTRDGRPWPAAAAGLLGVALMAALDFPPPTWVGLALSVTLTAALAATLLHAARSHSWGPAQATAVACGALLERTLVGYLSPLPPGVDLAPKLVQSTVLLVAVLAVSVARRTPLRHRRHPPRRGDALMAATQRWTLEHDGHTHLVEIDDAGLGRRIVWRRDDSEVVSRKTGDERVQLVPAGDASDAPDGIGAVGLRFGWFGPARRVTWYAGTREEAVGSALVGIGGVDFVPEPGSKAEQRQEWMRAHPRLYTARETGIAVGGVVGGLLVTWLLARLVFSFDLPDIPRPDLPRIPWPDLPSIPWPDLPSIPWPDVSVPGWVREAAELAKLVLPVLVAFAVARGEIRRRRRQDERRSTTTTADPDAGP